MIATPGYRPNEWGTLSDHERRIRGLEALDCCVPGGGPTLADTILGLANLDAFWKLNETSGTVAADSSGNGFDLDVYPVPPGSTAPTWGQTAGPPGETSALWNGSDVGEVRDPFTAFTANFSVFGWLYRNPGGAFSALAGEGASTQANSWSLNIVNSSAGGGNANKIAAYIGTTPFYSNAAILDSTWYMVALTRGASTWKMYLNGAVQTSMPTTSPGVVPTTFWLGNDGNGVSNRYFVNGLMSYWGLVARELTAVEILTLYDTAGIADAAGNGMVLTNPGFGGTPYWAFPVSTWVNGA